MANSFGPDMWDSDLSDDDYVSYGNQPEKVTFKQEPRILTEKEKQDQQKNLIYNAISSGNIKDVIRSIENGLRVDVCLQNNWSPLLLAASFGNAKLTEELLNRGADANSNRDGCTALMMACNCPKETSPYTETLKIIKVLVKHGADVKTTNRKRMTALMFAANVGNLPAVRYLLPLSDKNAEDNQKWTALFWAVNGNVPDVVKYLLEEDFKYTTPDVRNNTPIDIAKDNDFSEITKLFPQEDAGNISSIIDQNLLPFEEMFVTDQPVFFIDICDLLCGMRSESTIEHFANKKLTLKQFLSITDKELEELGLDMPFQRYRIKAGLYRFHKHPFHPKSLPVVPLNDSYSNNDIALQILSAIKQITAMEAGLHFIMKHCDTEEISDEQRISMKRNIENIRNKLELCSIISKHIHEKAKNCDKQREPVDLIDKYSCRRVWPWRKILFSFSVLSLVLVIKFKK